MKKFLSITLVGLIVFSSCQKMEAVNVEAEDASVQQPTQRKCESATLLQQKMDADPAFAQRMRDLEAYTAAYVASNLKSNRPMAVVNIPVYVNVLWRNTSEDISVAQIQSQIDVLNEDFSGLNPDFSKPLPAGYSESLKANMEVHFTLAGIFRKKTTKRSFGTNDDVKRSSRGGLDPTSPTTHLNIWSCTLSNGVLGYAQFPGGAAATDGVVILNTAFGRVGTAAYPFNLGRTATHEVGHWLNLRHIWGDATCGNDQVGDTPLHNTANYGCPSLTHASTCTGTPLELWMNYMDYTDDRCMYMFTQGQKARSQATYAPGGPRASYVL